ncbi:MAG: LCP family protein [Candidatus Levybacteria bacterium]|nr:LCP family protein [Candidatus Levybacteria bacterium]
MHKKVLIIFLILLLIVVGKITIEAVKFSPFLFQLIFTKDINLSKSDDHLNILLLGIGGGTHEGPDLTDTIIFASVDMNNNKAILASIPRDLWSPDLNAKINTAYSGGEAIRKGGGITLASSAISKILNQPINYTVRIDFKGFVKALDILGGLDVNVDKSFDDYEYPISGKEDDLCGHTQEEVSALATASSQLEAFPCRYTNIHFDKGLQHMDGKTALEFVRSRHAQGEEGTDFARSKRQEIIIKALKDKVFSLQVLANPIKVIGVYTAIKDSVDTNIKQEELDDFVRLAQKMKNVKIESAVLDYGDDQTGRPGLLINPPISQEFNYAWVLIPRIGNGNFSEIQKFVACKITIGNCVISQNPLFN